VPSRDPHEDKVRDYQHERRNAYGESDKGSRKSIRFRKKWINRLNRRAIHDALAAPTPDPDELNDIVQSAPRRRWKKVADRPLGEVLDRKEARRGKASEDDGATSSARREAHRRGHD
jgi:hypothetical protein